MDINLKTLLDRKEINRISELVKSEFKQLLKEKYSNISYNDFDQFLSEFTEDYIGTLYSDKNTYFPTATKKLNDEYTALRDLDISKIKNITINFNGSKTKSIKLESGQLFLVMMNKRLYPHTFEVYKTQLLTIRLKDVSNNIFDFLTKKYNSQLKSKYSKHKFISEIISIVSYAIEKKEYSLKYIQTLVKP